MRGLRAKKLRLHRIGAHGGSSLPAAAPVAQLIELAIDQGTEVYEVGPAARPSPAR
jgi:hypothetical protein